MGKYKKMLGSFGENLAKNYLTKNNYTLIASNKKLGYGEIDIIALYKKEVVFVEVKTRSSLLLGSAEDALRSSQIKTLKKTILVYCSKNKISLTRVRLDFISIDLDKKKKTAKIKHYKDII